MIINKPSVLAEVEAAFATYETALMTNDLASLDALFWPSELTVLIGPGQNLYGIDAIQAFRSNRGGGSPKRALLKVVITTFGEDFATANAEFQREGAATPGRQTQTWVRFSGLGWRVVSAHISRATNDRLANVLDVPSWPAAYALLAGKQRGARKAVVTMCIGGGMGAAALFDVGG